MSTAVSQKRLWRLRGGLSYALGVRRMSGDCMRVLIGHCTFCALVRRCSLSCFHECYQFIAACGPLPAAVWPGCIAELRCFRGMLPLLVSDWGLPWNREVYATDASLDGFGISVATWPTADVSAIGRVPERDRFRDEDAMSARRSALGAAGLLEAAGLCVDGPPKPVTRSPLEGELAGAMGELPRQDLELNEDFVEVPARLLRHGLWRSCSWGKWQFAGDIGELEARALTKGLRRGAQTFHGRNLRQLILVDNLGVCLAFNRGRSKSLRILKQIRLSVL